MTHHERVINIPARGHLIHPAPTFHASNMKLRTEERMRVYLRISPFSRLFMYGPGRGLDWSLFYRGDAIASGRSRTHAGAVRAMDRLTQKTINRQRHKAAAPETPAAAPPRAPASSSPSLSTL